MRGRNFFGIILILLGLGFLLQQFDIISFGEIIRIYWPSILIFMGIVGLFDRGSSKFGNFILILIGAMFQINRLGIVDINVFQFLFPIILILSGIKVLFSRDVKYEGHIYMDTDDNKKDNFKEYKSNKNVTLEDTIDEFLIMGESKKNNQSENFKGGRISATLGEVDLDLRGAKLYNNEAYIDVKAILAEVDIIVPENWRVEIKSTPILGECKNATIYNGDPHAPVLKIDCFALLGEIKVR